MKQCLFAQYVKCTECNVFLYKECKKFVVARSKYLCRDIMPFKLSQKLKVPGKFCWGRDSNKMKSVCLHYANKIGQQVKRVTINQVLSVVLSGDEVDGRVFYVDYSEKVQGDPEKVKGVLQSFIDQQLLRGNCISVYVGTGVVCQLDLEKKVC